MKQFTDWYKDDFGGFDTAREYAEAVWNAAQEAHEKYLEKSKEVHGEYARMDFCEKESPNAKND